MIHYISITINTILPVIVLIGSYTNITVNGYRVFILGVIAYTLWMIMISFYLTIKFQNNRIAESTAQQFMNKQ